MKYDYLITYNFTGEKGTGTGRVFVDTFGKIKSRENIEEAERVIKENSNHERVAVTNYQIIRRYWR